MIISWGFHHQHKVCALTTETTQIPEYSYSHFNQFQKSHIQPISYISSINNLYISSIPKDLYVAWWKISYISSIPTWICYLIFRLHISTGIVFLKSLRTLIILLTHSTKKWSFLLRISSVNVTKSAENCGFGHIYWTNPQWKTSFFGQWQKHHLSLVLCKSEVMIIFTSWTEATLQRSS